MHFYTNSSAQANENAAKLDFLETENATLRNKLQNMITNAGEATAEAAVEAEQQFAQMDTQVNTLRSQVAKLEREVDKLSKRNIFLEEANSRSTRGLRAGRAVVAASKRRRSKMRAVC